ncbi:conserved membrane hypothetical protein [Alteromonas macleodii]|uniref:hypothetical protein n=1 Tax=Alteromonas sp. BZK5 TaxID=1904459 RepID=UPI00165382B9|nr:hypothetical protein [Alteromonas sp. BZK5]MBC6987683.1 hypothetical protein [Alteromonas sp. BZK5]|tara:strand:- start:11488 stop:13002 length:1515 start_codon:yes stop_codon:yes gene_type:complete
MPASIGLSKAMALRFLVPAFCALVLVGLCTNWTFNLFAPQFLWKAYNYYFLAMIDGRLDIPAEAIGKEGGYFNGKAYMYYGLLPALARIVLYPFVDLSQTPTSIFFVLLFTLVGLVVLQREVNRKLFLYEKEGDVAALLLWLTITAVIWLGSATFIISQNGTIYHEPYAASLCIFNIFISRLLRDNLLESKAINAVNVLPYAVLAALAVHTRMPMALALYLVTGLIMLVVAFKQVNRTTNRYFASVVYCISYYWLSLLVLLCGGASILALNYVKYGNALAFMGGNYGYFFLEGFTDRVCDVVPRGDFYRFFRIIANSYIYLTGDWANHWSLTRLLETGYGRWEGPLIPLYLLWLFPLFCLLGGVASLVKGIKSTKNILLLLGLFLISSGALFQLSYPTITHRYVAELWSPFGVAVLYVYVKLLATDLKLRLASVFLLVACVGVAYQLKLSTSDQYYVNDGPIYDHYNYHYSESDNKFLANLDNEKISLFKKEQRKQKKIACRNF